MTPITAIGGARLCGSGRIAGEMYLECGLIRGGSPMEDYLVDPPQPIDQENWGISPIGVTTFEEDGVTHVIDWVGEQVYPEVADFIEEARRKGISRKVTHTLGFEKLTAESRLYLIHPQASVTQAAALTSVSPFRCPCGQHHQPQEDCIGLAWHVPANAGPGRRKLAEGETYPVRSSLPSATERQLALFMVVPLTCITVIEHPDNNVTADREANAKKSGLPVFISQE